MQDMLKKIIEMDEQARLIKEKAQKEKAEKEIEIEKIKQDIYNDYINRAKERVEKNLSVDRKNAQKEWEATLIKHEQILNDMQAKDKENHETWVKNIVENVINN